MKAKELMIGDWVQSDDKPYKYYAPYLNLDNDLSDGCWIVDSDCQRYFTGLTDIKPILLTAEILEKNGFSDKYAYDDLSYAADAGGDIIGVHILGQGGLMDEMYFDYVHQLQHALRLCGLNDLADNFKV